MSNEICHQIKVEFYYMPSFYSATTHEQYTHIHNLFSQIKLFLKPNQMKKSTEEENSLI